MGIYKKYMPESVSALFVLVFRFIFYKNVQIAILAPDSNSYLHYSFPGTRTPGYPLILKLIHMIAGEKYQLTAVVIFQITISLTAVFLLYRAVRLVTENRWISCVAATFWGGLSWNYVLGCLYSYGVFKHISQHMFPLLHSPLSED